MENNKKEEREFETRLFLHRPEIYEKYMEDKKEREADGYDHIVWKEPETVEELDLIMETVRRHEEMLAEQENASNVPKTLDDSLQTGIIIDDNIDDFADEIEFLKKFEDIDISQLGEEDG